MDKADSADKKASTFAVATRSPSHENAGEILQTGAIRLNEERACAWLFCGIICYLLASAIWMSQQQLVFAPNGIVDLGAVRNSGSGSRYLAINGVQHVSKCKSHSNGPWVCFNEFFAARIASSIGLPVSPYRLVSFRGGLPLPETWFCSQRIEPGDNPDAVSFTRLRNQDSLGRIAVFDLWLCNIDRKNPNLFVERFQDGTERLFIIDHGHILFTTGNLADLRSPGFRDGRRFLSGCPDLVASIENVNEFASGLQAIQSITEREIGDYIENSPAEWIPDSGMLKDLKEYLLQRRDELGSILEANLSFFPNLKRGVA